MVNLTLNYVFSIENTLMKSIFFVSVFRSDYNWPNFMDLLKMIKFGMNELTNDGGLWRGDQSVWVIFMKNETRAAFRMAIDGWRKFFLVRIN